METVLLYNIAGTPLAGALKPVLLKLKLRIRVISEEQYLQPVGRLAGISGLSGSDQIYDGEGFREPMMVMCGFSERRLDQLLREMKIQKVPAISLKAVLTPQNQNWDSLTLYRELKSEHEALHTQNSR